jgi:hypothetical protein
MTKRSGFGSPSPNSTKNTAALLILVLPALGDHCTCAAIAHSVQTFPVRV